MRIVLLTQDDPFYLPETTEDFLKRIKQCREHELVSVIVSSASPFGKREHFLKKAKKTYAVFGFRFFIHYTTQFIYRKILLGKSVQKVVNQRGFHLWKLAGSINAKENYEKLAQLKPDLIIIIAGNQIIKKKVLDLPAYGVINAHSSLLPAYKGLMPSFWVLKNNEKVTGVTVFKLGEGIDDGPIINSKVIEISANMTQAELVKRSKYIANELLIEAIDMVSKPDLFKENKGGSYFKFPTRADVDEFYKAGKRFY